MDPRIFITSDLHLFHRRILEFCPKSRPFKDIDEMHYHLIQNWNNKVSGQDNVYILGDVAFSNAKDASQFMDRLHGQKFLIRGNHDSKLVKSSDFKQRFAWIKDYYELRYNNKKFMLMHYPMMFWNNQHHGSYMLHGHMHSINPEKLNCRRWDVGMDGSSDFAPYLLDDLVSIIDNNYVEVDNVCHHGREVI